MTGSEKPLGVLTGQVLMQGITMDRQRLLDDGHEHKPVQHRDGKPPWCRECGLTAAHTEPVSRLDKTSE